MKWVRMHRNAVAQIRSSRHGDSAVEVGTDEGNAKEYKRCRMKEKREGVYQIIRQYNEVLLVEMLCGRDG